MEEAEKTWIRIRAHGKITQLLAGVVFNDGVSAGRSTGNKNLPPDLKIF